MEIFIILLLLFGVFTDMKQRKLQWPTNESESEKDINSVTEKIDELENEIECLEEGILTIEEIDPDTMTKENRRHNVIQIKRNKKEIRKLRFVTRLFERK